MYPERLRNLRLSKKKTQKQVADMLGITRQGYGNYENGVTEPDNDSLAKLADYFETSTDYLMGRIDEQSFKSKENNNTAAESTTPYFATPKDKRDFKKFLEQQEVMFDGVPMTDEDKARVLGYMEGMFWEAKQMNKTTYGRKKSTRPDND